MTTYERIPLGQVCAIDPRARRAPGFDDDTMVSFVPMSAVDERTATIAAPRDRRLAEVSKGYTAFEDGDILFAKITPCMENGKVALAENLTNGIGRGSTEFFVLRPYPRILPQYLYHFVRQPVFRELARRHFTGTAGQQRVPKSFMETTSIPVPPHDRQRKIVNVLKRTDGIRRLQTQVSDCLRDFPSALFSRLFGDIDRNPNYWQIGNIGDVCTVSGGGTPRRANSAFFGGGIPWATPTDVTALRSPFIFRTKDTITELGLRKSSARIVPEGAVLMTSRATIGYTAITTRPMATNQGFANFVCGDALTPEYLSFFLRSRTGLLLQIAGGTTFKEVTKTALKKVQIPLPPMTVQRHFGKALNRLAQTEDIAAKAAEKADMLRESLMTRLLDRDLSTEGME